MGIREQGDPENVIKVCLKETREKEYVVYIHGSTLELTLVLEPTVRPRRTFLK